MGKSFICETCNYECKTSFNFNRHNNSENHKKKVSTMSIQNENIDDDQDTDIDIQDEDPLSNLEVSFVEEKPIKIKQPKQFKVKEVKFKEPKITNIVIDSNESEILGLNKRVLIKKISEYECLFKDELKTFKYTIKNKSESQLQEILNEMSCIVETSSVNQFVEDAVIKSIEVIEGVSAKTKNYNITGLSVMLNSNAEFKKIMKLLYIKYTVFSNIPPEIQLVFIISTCSYICMNKNKYNGMLDMNLDEPYTEQIETKANVNENEQVDSNKPIVVKLG